MMNDQLADNLKDYSVVQVLQNGHLNTCYKVVHRGGGPPLVLKALDYNYLSEHNRKALKDEVKLLSRVHHDNLVRWLKCITHTATSTLYIVMELCEGGDVEQLIQKCKPGCNYVAESFIWKVLYQTSRGLHAFHSRLPNAMLLHCDIRPANVFLSANGTVKLSGFQLLNHSPTQLESQQRSRSASVCAMGQLIFMLATLSLSPDRYHRLPLHYSSDLQTMVGFMKNLKPEMNPSIDVILYHPLVVTHVALTSLKYMTLEASEQRGNCPASGRSSASGGEEKPCLRCKDLEAKLDSLLQKEAAMKVREAILRDRENMLCKREKHTAVLQRLSREQTLKAEVALSQCRDPRTMNELPDDLNDSSYSADTGDTSALPTTSKLDPGKIKKPSFLTKRTVHFNSIADNGFGDHMYRTDKKSNSLPGKPRMKNGKENVPQGVGKQRHSNVCGSMLSLRISTKEHLNGILETDML